MRNVKVIMRIEKKMESIEIGSSLVEIAIIQLVEI